MVVMPKIHQSRSQIKSWKTEAVSIQTQFCKTTFVLFIFFYLKKELNSLYSTPMGILPKKIKKRFIQELLCGLMCAYFGALDLCVCGGGGARGCACGRVYMPEA